MGEVGLNIAGSLGWATLITTATWFARAVAIGEDVPSRDLVFTFAVGFLAAELFRVCFL